ncbi:hypothetical protein GCM10027076_18040 [Nocardioides montaniterrae]
MTHDTSAERPRGRMEGYGDAMAEWRIVSNHGQISVGCKDQAGGPDT